MAKTKRSTSVLDAVLGEFRRQLEYKCVGHRKHLAGVDRYFPSSKLCRACGSIHPDLTLSQRVWTCGCGAVHDRDLNAAWNLRAEGMRHIPRVHGRSPSREGIVPLVHGACTVPKGIVPVAVGHTDTQTASGYRQCTWPTGPGFARASTRPTGPGFARPLRAGIAYGDPLGEPL